VTQRILIASGNAKKLAELRAICQSLPIEILGPEALSGGLPEVDEDQPDFVGNAKKKALSAAQAAQELGADVWALADDSGLCVDALQGRPGVHSARYAGIDDETRDYANNQKLLKELDGLAREERKAQFQCVIAIAHQDQILFHVHGTAQGHILEAPEGVDGFGYDPLFYHGGSGRTFACLSGQEKAQVSHRGQAVAKLHTKLQERFSHSSE
jgi:XTP/dITP diphosphohydrolase